MPREHPSGRQLSISHGDQSLTAVQVGGGIREYRRGTRPILDPYGMDEMCPAAHGQLLLPWPNRLGGGRYRFQGRELQLPLTEPERGTAIHGLLRWVAWEVASEADDHVALAARIYPQTGYPFLIDARIEYHLDDAGLTVIISATNPGDEAAPFGVGQHPYLSPGASTVDGARLRVPAGRRLEVDERLLPTGRTADVGGPLDFREQREIGTTRLDHCFTGLERDAQGRASIDLEGQDGVTVTLWMDMAWGWAQIFTADSLPGPLTRRALAVEPMTCPPDAFRSGDGLIVLQPGGRFSASWGITVR